MSTLHIHVGTCSDVYTVVSNDWSSLQNIDHVSIGLSSETNRGQVIRICKRLLFFFRGMMNIAKLTMGLPQSAMIG